MRTGRLLWTAAALGGAACVAASFLPAFRVRLEASIGAEDAQQTFDYERTWSLVDYGTWFAIAAVVACVLLLHRGLLIRIRGDVRDLRVGLRLGLSGLRFLHAHVLLVAGQVVALLLGDGVGGFRAGDPRIVLRGFRALVRGLVVGHGDLFLRLGFLDGKEGFIFHYMQAFWYRLLVDINRDELRRSRTPRAELELQEPVEPLNPSNP